MAWSDDIFGSFSERSPWLGLGDHYDQHNVDTRQNSSIAATARLADHKRQHVRGEGGDCKTSGNMCVGGGASQISSLRRKGQRANQNIKGKKFGGRQIIGCQFEHYIVCYLFLSAGII